MNHPDAGSLFEALLAETVGPCVLDVAGRTVVVEVPTGADVARLDTARGPAQVLDAIAGPDLADDIWELLAGLPGRRTVCVVDRLRRHFALVNPPRPGGLTTVVREIDRYGAAIEADLVFAGTGLVLGDWFRDPDRYPWSMLIRLLHRMPEGGHYETARRDDDQLAAQLHDLRERGLLPAPSRRPALLGWTRDRELATATADALRRIEWGIWGASPKFKGKGGRPPKALPRPRSASDRLGEVLLMREHDEIAGALLGDRYRPRTAPATDPPTGTTRDRQREELSCG